MGGQWGKDVALTASAMGTGEKHTQGPEKAVSLVHPGPGLSETSEWKQLALPSNEKEGSEQKSDAVFDFVHKCSGYCVENSV